MSVLVKNRRPQSVVYFASDGFTLNRTRLMGRQSAGNGFLRAAVANRSDAQVWGSVGSALERKAFEREVLAIDPKARPHAITHDDLAALSDIGTLSLPGPNLAPAANLRLRRGATAYSVVGLTHTTASLRAMESIAGVVSAPVMPWDALICTSSSVADMTRKVISAEFDFLRWRFGASRQPLLPQLEVIPLGTHARDFEATPEQKREARQSLGIDPDEIVIVYVGRLSFHAKAHPYPMLASLGAQARPGTRLVLLQCGWFASDVVRDSFRRADQAFAPNVRHVYVDGRTQDNVRKSWRCGDIFMSLSDNIQETFGLTPIEAMAAGLPSIVTDWNGYKDTVRDGLDGFRIPTWMPPEQFGNDLTRCFEAQTISYDRYLAHSCSYVSLDMDVLGRRLAELIESAELRRRLGEEARRFARREFDWNVVYRRYQDLWARLAKIRKEAVQRKVTVPVREAPRAMNPFKAFSSYPTHRFTAETMIELVPGTTKAKVLQVAKHQIFASLWGDKGFDPRLLQLVLDELRHGPTPLRQIIDRAGAQRGRTAGMVMWIAKMGLLRLSNPEDAREPEAAADTAMEMAEV